MTLERLIWEKQKRSEGGKLSRKAAEDEVVAQFCQGMLTNKTTLETFAKESPKGFAAFAKWVRDFMAKIRDKLERMPEAVNELAIYQKMEDSLKEAFGELWAKAVMGAVETHDTVYEESGNESNKPKYQLREYSQKQKDNWANSNNVIFWRKQHSQFLAECSKQQ